MPTYSFLHNGCLNDDFTPQTLTPSNQYADSLQRAGWMCMLVLAGTIGWIRRGWPDGREQHGKAYASAAQDSQE